MATNENSQDKISVTSEINKRKIKKYRLGTDITFEFPYLLDEATISYINQVGHVMIIIRGLPGTGKAYLSETITTHYPQNTFCCADKYFENSFDSIMERNKDTLRLSHKFCMKQAEIACQQKKPIIVVQNTHMRKWEMQPYIDYAVKYNYTVIMAITMYIFDVTKEELYDLDGLDYSYVLNRFKQWVDVPPLFTGWFLGPNDSNFLRDSVMLILESLLGDGKFSRIFDAYNSEEIFAYFEARNMLACIAGYTPQFTKMKQYYLSDDVRYFYGKCFSISILGYIVSKSDILGIVNITDDMEVLMLMDDDPSSAVNDLCLEDNIYRANKTIPLKKCNHNEGSITASLVNWEENEDIAKYKTTFIHLAKKQYSPISSIDQLHSEFNKCIKNIPNPLSYEEMEDGTNICRLPDNTWLVKPTKKVVCKTLFSGLYI